MNKRITKTLKRTAFIASVSGQAGKKNITVSLSTKLVIFVKIDKDEQ